MDCNELQYNGHKYKVTEEYIYIDNICYKLPRKTKHHRLTIIKDKIYINGYEFKDGRFKKTLKAIYYKYY